MIIFTLTPMEISGSDPIHTDGTRDLTANQLWSRLTQMDQPTFGKPVPGPSQGSAHTCVMIGEANHALGPRK